jgi:hypothetical protein
MNAHFEWGNIIAVVIYDIHLSGLEQVYPNKNNGPKSPSHGDPWLPGSETSCMPQDLLP